MSFHEVEFKYNAKNINIKDLHQLARSLGKSEYFEQYGTDTFYHNGDGNSTKFCRHRMGGDLNELTYKHKTSSTDSVIRDEVNVNLSEDTDWSTVEEFLQNMGYFKGATISKTSLVYVYEDFVLAYYVCYNKNLQELGRFLEIEIREDKNLGTTSEQLSYLKILERNLKDLGLTPKDRINESLFEMFGLDNTEHLH